MKTYAHTKMRVQIFIVAFMGKLQKLETSQIPFLWGMQAAMVHPYLGTLDNEWA